MSFSSSSSTGSEFNLGEPNRMRGVFNETYVMMSWQPVNDLLPMHGAVVAWRSRGKSMKCDAYKQPESPSYYSNTYSSQASDTQGYCWSGYILRNDAYRDLAEER